MGLVYFERKNRRKEGINAEGTEFGAPLKARGKQRARRHPGHITSLRRRIGTVSPAEIAARSAGTTRKQFARARAATSPEPCHVRGLTSGVDPCQSTRAGRKCASPGFSFKAT